MPEEILRALLSQGILGVLTALFVGLYLREQYNHQQTAKHAAERAQELLEKAAREAREMAAVHAQQIKEFNTHITDLRTEQANEVRELLEQINDLREAHAQRERACLQTVEFFAKQEVEAVEELSQIAAILRRAYETLARRG